MRFIRSLVLLFSLSAFLYSSEYFVKIGTTSNQEQVLQINSYIQKMGYPGQVHKKEGSYSLYAGPFANQEETVESFTKIKRVFPDAAIVKLHKDTSVVAKSSQKQVAKPKQESKRELDSFFVALALGYNANKGSYSGDNNVSKVMPAESGLSYSLEVGYNYDEDIWASIGYGIYGTDDTSLSNLYTTLNYNFYNHNSLSVYTGAILGWSTLAWDTPPLEGSEELSNSTSLVVGVQVGVKYYLPVDGLSVYSTLQYLMFDHSMELNEDGNIGHIEHTSLQNLQIGVAYSF